MNESITITAPVEVPIEFVADTLCSALEGGSNYWIEAQVTQFNSLPDGTEAKWAHEAIAHGAKFAFKVFEEDEYQNPELDIAAALSLMATKYPRHFGDLVGETGDAETGDILFQLICFGEIVYG